MPNPFDPEKEAVDMETADPVGDTETPALCEWKTIAERGAGWLTDAPPPREYLLRSLDGQAGMLAVGDVGIFAAAGGGGKSMAFSALALCVAAGEAAGEPARWLESFEVARSGRVLLAMGEEDEGEMRRRLYHAGTLMKLTPAELHRAASRIVALPLAGLDVALTSEPNRAEGLPRTRLAEVFARHLEADGAADPWALLMFDPLSRFAGPDVEKDNAAATRFIQVAETFTKAPGSPTVLIAHHTNAQSRKADATSPGATSVRGVTGIGDGARWVAQLESIQRPEGARDEVPDLLMFRVTKSNHARWSGQDVMLCRDRAHGGALRRPTLPDHGAHDAAVRAAKAAKDSAKTAPRTPASREAGDDARPEDRWFGNGT